MPKSVAIFSLIIAFALTLALYIGWQGHAPWARSSLPKVTHIAIPLEVQRLERVLFGLERKEQLQAFLDSHPVFTTQFLHQVTDPSSLVDKLYAMVQNPDMGDLYQEVQRVFSDTAALQAQLQQAFRYLKYYYPDFQPPQVVTFVTGMGVDLYVSQELIVIGLDFFMGEEAKFRPTALPQYILRTYQPAYLVPKIILLLSQHFNKVDATDQTLLADMLYYGKALYFAQAVLPQVADHLLLGYTPAQLDAVRQHQEGVWTHFIDQALFYTTNHLTQSAYIDDRPFTVEIDAQCPGRIGQWLGWEIVKEYMQRHPHVDLKTLMACADMQALFSQAKYRPKRAAR